MGILDFIHFPEDEEWCHSIFLVDKKPGKRYTELLEIRILELKKLPGEQESEDILLRWMRFFRGKNRNPQEDPFMAIWPNIKLERMAKTDEYIGEAYQDLVRFSADETKRELYEARAKALRDYNSQMQSAREYGFQEGYDDGMEAGRKARIEVEKRRMVEKKLARGKSPSQIAEELEEDMDTICRLIKELKDSVPSGV
ncbi:MAG TPA: PD-(D/E)XK nuclease family transposase [Candidatus Pullilachnospira intestinigallinarum]|nr:PD-(D/E)XK nuclease family transposase [Candidatus Pullilachnospira intestinigallinarum]